MSSKFDVFFDGVNKQTIKRVWGELEARSVSSAFVSWPWIGHWLSVCPDNVQIKQVTIVKDGQLFGLGLLSESAVVRHRVFRSKMLALHEYAEPNLDMMIEYNGLLLDKNLPDDCVQAVLVSLVKAGSWDELKLSGIELSSSLLDAELHRRLKLNCHVVAKSYARSVNFDVVRERGGDFIMQLRRKTRYKLRKYLAEYADIGELKVSEACDADTALAYFDELEQFHQCYWLDRGQEGSFSNPDWVKFHRGLIKGGVGSRSLQILKVTAGSEVVGYVYSLLKNKHVYMIQSGYNYDEEKKYHPGYVSLYLAINYNFQQGNRKFDFLAGDNQYKKSFSNDQQELVWVVLQKKRVRFLVESGVRWVKRKILGQSSDVSF